MRYFIAILLVINCFSSSLYAKKTKSYDASRNLAEKSTNFTKKNRNSLKTEFFSNQVDCLNLNYQTHSLVAVYFIKIFQSSWVDETKRDFSYSLNTPFCYSLVFQHLYPKHSFW